MYKGIDLSKRHYLDNYVCELYLTTKGKQRPHDYSIKPGKHNLDLVYSDVVGLILVKGYNSSRYLVTFMCDRSKLMKVYFIKTKGKVYDCFLYFKKHYKRPDLGWTIKRLYNNGGGEYISNKLKAFLFKNSINLELIELYTS
jgi:hypothetical protein